MQARDVMVSPVITVAKSATVREVAKILLEKHITAVPVVDPAGKLVGIVSEGDLMRRTEVRDRTPVLVVGALPDRRCHAGDRLRQIAREKDYGCHDLRRGQGQPVSAAACDCRPCSRNTASSACRSSTRTAISSASSAGSNVIQVIASVRPNSKSPCPMPRFEQKLLAELKKQAMGAHAQSGRDGYRTELSTCGVMLSPMRSGKRSASRQRAFRASLKSTITSWKLRSSPTDPRQSLLQRLRAGYAVCCFWGAQHCPEAGHISEQMRASKGQLGLPDDQLADHIQRRVQQAMPPLPRCR